MGSENGGRGAVDRAKKGLKLFGVRIVDGEKLREEGAAARAGVGDVEEATKSMLKSLSMGNLVACTAIEAGEQGDCHQGYLSDGGLVPSSRRGGQERKRGVPWSEEEHRTFLAGLAKLGKGDWRGISRNYVTTRTPTQVASHAQKYFLRQSNPNKKKRRSSLFDVVINNKAAYLQNPPMSPLKKSEEAFNKLAISSSLTTTQAAFPGSSSCSSTSTLHNEISAEQADPTLSLNLKPADSEHSVPSLLKLSPPLSPPQRSTSSPPATNNDLELSIAPPQSHSSLAKLSSGTISVI